MRPYDPPFRRPFPRIIVIRRKDRLTNGRVKLLGTIKQSMLIFCRASCSRPLSNRRIQPRWTDHPDSFARLDRLFHITLFFSLHWLRANVTNRATGLTEDEVRVNIGGYVSAIQQDSRRCLSNGNWNNSFVALLKE